MITTSISKAKASLSHFLERVRAGETVLVTDRHRPVAVLRGVDPGMLSEDLAALAADGVVTLRREKLDVAGFLASRKGQLPGGVGKCLDDERTGR